MSNERHRIKEEELRALEDARLKNPQAFEKTPQIENPAYLDIFGIYIPQKDTFPKGYVKILRQDFIVEEVLNDGTICTISKSENKPIISEGETVYATLVKCGISTLEAIEDMAKTLHCPTSSITYSGIKDKDAVTSQRISIRGVPFEKIQNLSSPYFFLKDFTIGKGVIQKGNLKGNRFTILVRTQSDFFKPEVSKLFFDRLKKIVTNGFYNYYYLQRFGVPRLRNFIWGLYILKKQYKEAIEDFLTEPGPGELPFFKTIRHEIREKLPDYSSVKKILEPYPIIFRNELSLVNHLIEKPNDYQGALFTLKDQVTLWIYGFSSWLFNSLLGHYVQTRKPIPPTLPLFLSRNYRDVNFYKYQLTELDIFPPPLNNLQDFPFVQITRREVPTIEHVELLAAEIIDEGIVLSFFLGKGDYATTFLSHLFNLVSTPLPNEISQKSINIMSLVGEENTEETFKHFKEALKRNSEDKEI